MVQEQVIGRPQNLEHLESDPITPSDASIQRVRDEYGWYGAWIENVDIHSVFLYCQDLLGIAAFVEQHRSWFEEHAQANKEWLANHLVGKIVSVRLRSKRDPGEQRVLTLETENRFAWYGTPIPQNASEGRRPSDELDLQEYLRIDWEEYGGHIESPTLQHTSLHENSRQMLLTPSDESPYYSEVPKKIKKQSSFLLHICAPVPFVGSVACSSQ